MTKKLIALTLPNNKTIIGVWMNDHTAPEDAEYFVLRNPFIAYTVVKDGRIMTAYDTVIPFNDSESHLFYKTNLLGFTFPGQMILKQYNDIIKHNEEAKEKANTESPKDKTKKNFFMPDFKPRKGIEPEDLDEGLSV